MGGDGINLLGALCLPPTHGHKLLIAARRSFLSRVSGLFLKKGEDLSYLKGAQWNGTWAFGCLLHES